MSEIDDGHGRFGSKDFWKVPARLTARMPGRLIHADVSRSASAGAENFSVERKHPVHIVDLPSFSINMTLGGLLPGQATNRHRHNYETIIYIIRGNGITTVEDTEIEWHPGDAIYIPVWAWHRHRNLSEDQSCQYVACENAAMLQNMGGIAVREEADQSP